MIGVLLMVLTGVASASGHSLDTLKSGGTFGGLDSMSALAEVGTSHWDPAVSGLLLTAYDADGSGQLDRKREVRAIPCQVWDELETGARIGWGTGLLSLYGFESGQVWLGYALGFSSKVRRAARSAVSRWSPRTRSSRGRRGEALADVIRSIPNGLSDPWDQRAQALLVGAYDLDFSGALDNVDEVGRISCAQWSALDEGASSAWGVGLQDVYGFGSDEWYGDALGFAASVRREAEAAFAGCRTGKRPEPVASGLVERIEALPSGGSSEWDQGVAGLLADRFDANDSGLLDSADEIGSVSCEVWAAIDTGVREEWPSGLYATYGFSGGSVWVGYVLGISESLRGETGETLVGCGLSEGNVGWAFDDDPVASRIRSFPDGGSGPWDESVARELALFDFDGSGTLDADPEVGSIPCPVWSAIDDGIREGWGSGLYAVYGFGPEFIWVGYALGIAEGQRPAAAMAVSGCGLGAGGPVVPGAMGRVRGLPEAGTGDWDREVSVILTEGFDLDGSGVLDTEEELKAVDCEVWAGLDVRVEQAWGAGLAVVYGFDPDLIWVGQALGIAEPMRAIGFEVINSCVAVARADLDVDPAQAIEAVPEGGSSPWDDRVRRILLHHYDADLSGRLDQEAEVRLVTCAVWEALDAGVQHGWDGSLFTIYGFSPGFIWVGYAIGIDESQRDAASRALAACDLGSDTDAQIADAIRLLPNGGSTDWDEEVKAILSTAFDGDDSGSIDATEEVTGIPCAVWAAIDKGVRVGWDDSVYAVYGFDPENTWVGYTLGFDESMRATSAAAISGCALD